ncbi:MAG: hypothetical protein CVU84_09740 [Firmicutes bacterium HGW-Firmicutes-1]|jgi:multimeric flavodoxin WrbA|nr:MAG: hypothetical protein CVU84_09740 [Firmicutes bacterium HGW-Firmicutes-1]
MKIVVLDGMEQKNPLSNPLMRSLEDNNTDYSYFKLMDMDIKPCRSCGVCGLVTPGKCSIKDDIEIIMSAVAKSTMLIFLTPIRFGGYSSELKKIIDRFMLLGLPLYIVRKGHLLHPSRYNTIKWLFVIGLSENKSLVQEESLRKLVKNNALNMRVSQKALIFKPTEDGLSIKTRIDYILEGVGMNA